MNIFITGTDTDVGKTIVSGWICMHSNAKYWKPIQTGDESDSKIIQDLSPLSEILREKYVLNAPLSPYDSAILENKKINSDNFLKNVPDKTVIEGAGGILVPISKNFYMADLIKLTNSKVIIVAKSKLGFLNHIFLTVNELKSRNIEILGIVINWDVENNLIETIEKFSGIRVLKAITSLGNIKESLQKIEIPHEILEVLK